MVKRKYRHRKIRTNLFLVAETLAILILTFIVFFTRQTPGQAQFSVSALSNLKKLPPEKIIIPSLAIDLPVVEAPIVDGFWKTSTDSASFGLGSAYPGEVGNTVIFAHATAGLFGNLGSIKEGAVIYVLSKDEWFSFKVTDVKSVLPTVVEVIAPTSDKTLTLYTCSGFRDAYRFVVTAKATP